MPPLAYSIPEVCKTSDAGRTTIYKAINAGELVAHKRGSRTIIFSSDLERWLNSLPEIEAKHSKRAEAIARAASQKSGMPDRSEGVDPTKKEPSPRKRPCAV
jgi:excisionase family DNA binding protein